VEELKVCCGRVKRIMWKSRKYFEEELKVYCGRVKSMLWKS